MVNFGQAKGTHGNSETMAKRKEKISENHQNKCHFGKFHHPVPANGIPTLEAHAPTHRPSLQAISAMALEVPACWCMVKTHAQTLQFSKQDAEESKLQIARLYLHRYQGQWLPMHANTGKIGYCNKIEILPYDQPRPTHPARYQLYSNYWPLVR